LKGSQVIAGDATELLNAIEQGDASASGRLLPLVYAELRRLAARNMRRESPDHTLQPTALVHEAYMRLVGAGAARRWNGRSHFFAAAADAMRRILIEAARRKKTLKYGGDLHRQELTNSTHPRSADPDERLLALNESLEKLRQIQPDLVRLVELRFFAGFSIDEAADIVDISPRTAKRQWSYARAWLAREMQRE